MKRLLGQKHRSCAEGRCFYFLTSRAQHAAPAPPHIIIPPVQYSQHFTSSSLSPVSASLFESINTIQYNPESGSPMPPLTSIQLNEEKQQIANIIKDSASFTAGK